jgi:hypothetical protein
MHEGRTFTSEEAESEAVFDYYDALLGTRFHRLHRIDLERLELPRLDLQELAVEFTEAEIAKIVQETPADRTRGLDGFTARFYRAAWPIIKEDICSTFNALWQQDWRSFYLLNDASIVLLRKNETPAGLWEYRPISLIHSFSKLVPKGLALWLTPFMNSLVRSNQTIFIKGDGFMTISAPFSCTAGGCTLGSMHAFCSRLILLRHSIPSPGPCSSRSWSVWVSHRDGGIGLR